jgi:hypothetical protein
MVNIILNGERLNIVLLRSEAKQRCLFSPLLLNVVVKVLAKTTGQEEKINGI